MTLRRFACSPAISLAGLSLALLPAMPASAATLAEAVSGGKAALELRYRAESVEQDPFTEDALASTLRTRLRYTTASWQDITGLVEFENVSRIGEDRYNDTRNGKVQYPTVVDPDGADLNQASLTWTGVTGLRLVGGRQRVNLDNQRFVGSVGWRQNEQTLDALLAEYRAGEQWQLTGAWVGRVNRVFGPDDAATPASFEGDSLLLNARWTLSPALALTAYAYQLDFDDAPASSLDTAGLRANGTDTPGGLSLGYALEAAQQQEGGDNPVAFEAPYLLAEVSLAKGAWKLEAGYELLGSDGGVAAVQTPLATGHKFQGWADKFLTTPTNGLVDTWVGGAWRAGAWTLSAASHAFEADEGGADLGSEIDVQLAATLFKRYTVTMKFADYSAGDVPAYTDTRKAWLMLEARY